MSGTNSEVAGMLSAISSMKTEKASSTVMPSVIFSPESGGSQKPKRLGTNDGEVVIYVLMLQLHRGKKKGGGGEGGEGEETPMQRLLIREC